VDKTRTLLLEEIVRLAERAGSAIMEIYRSDFAVERKTDRSPVTAADRAAEEIILEGLTHLTPGIPAVSEEDAAAGKAPAVGREFWLVDPLDGTKEFVERLGEFTVNIALVVDDLPVLGVIHDPVARTSYAGAGPGTSTRRRPGQAPEHIEARVEPAEGAVLLVSRFHHDPARVDAFLAAQKQRVASHRTAGSALKFALIAAGEADLYPRFGPTMEWDTGAGHALLLAAGGSIETLEGTRLRYGKPGFRNAGFVARGRPRPASS
jgi:3'(2'), 5'-bisphosphate nucleotidase